jgi:hypothetical protein
MGPSSAPGTSPGSDLRSDSGWDTLTALAFGDFESLWFNLAGALLLSAFLAWLYWASATDSPLQVARDVRAATCFKPNRNRRRSDHPAR